MITPPSHDEICRILSRFHGSKKELARRAKVSPCSVSGWLDGRPSANIGAHAAELYQELREQEQALAKTA